MTAAPSPSVQALAAIERLVAFPTVSRDSNLGLIESVRDELARLGVRSRLTYDDAGRKANLFATVGEGPDPGLILSGHTDVVPVDGQAWQTDPFRLTLRDGRLYGRGAADMKGFLGVVLSLVPQMLSSALRAPFHLALSYDEEVGCIGVRGLLKDLEDSGLQVAGCVVGEPTDMEVVVGHKGSRAYRCCVTGREAHSSLAPSGVNAIEYAALLVARIRALADELEAHEARNAGFDVPFTTLQTGVIKGGIATNVVPRDCEFRFDMRFLAGTDPDRLIAEIEAYARQELLPRMRRVAEDADIRFDMMVEVPAFATVAGSPLLAQMRALAGSARVAHVGFGTEAGLFQRLGIPTIVCGPGSIARAHQPDEYVSRAQIARCEAFVRALIDAGEREDPRRRARDEMR